MPTLLLLDFASRIEAEWIGRRPRRDEVQAPGSQSSLREANSQRILEALRTYGAITQVELAGATGLSAATSDRTVAASTSAC